MKKVLFLFCMLILLALLCACNAEDQQPVSCAELGGHEMQYAYGELVHWQECVREGCGYKTSPSGHTGGTATCTEKAACEICGALYGAAGAHKIEYRVEGDTHIGQCINEGCTYLEEAQAHSGGKATCNTLAACTACGALYGELGDHQMGYYISEETHTYRCVNSNCSYTETAQAHSGGEPTCTEGALCEACGYPYQPATGHSYALIEDACVLYDACQFCDHRIIKQKNHTLDSDGLHCSKCKKNYFTETLSFALSDDGKSYVVTGSEDCKAETVIVPAEYQGLPVTEIGEFSFSFHKTMTAIVLPESLTTICSFSFDGTMLRHLTLPNSVVKIEGEAFGDSKLESITFGTGLKVIGEEAFCCTLFKRLVIPGTVESIEQDAFRMCEQLEEIVFEDGVKEIDQWAFRFCDKLQKVTLPQTLEYLNVSVYDVLPAFTIETVCFRNLFLFFKNISLGVVS